MRILHVIPELADYNGGPPQALATLARAQAAAGDDITVLPARTTSGPQTMPAGRWDRLNVLEGVTHGGLRWYDARLKRALVDLAAQNDIVHIHGTWRYHLLAAAGAARRSGVPFLIRPYGNLGVVNRAHKSLIKKPYFELIERPVIERAAAIHCCSLKEQDELAGLGLRTRTFVVGLPVETDLTQLQPDFVGLEKVCPLPQTARVVLFLGRIARVKQLDQLVSAFSNLAQRFPAWILVLAGPAYEPETAAALQAQIGNAGLADRVRLPGMVRGAIKSALLRRADIFAQPSAHENFGISLVEGLLFGKPAVVSSGVAIAAEVEAAGAGIVCSPDIGSLEGGISDLMESDGRRESCGRAAANLANRYMPAGVAAELRAEYEVCLDFNSRIR